MYTAGELQRVTHSDTAHKCNQCELITPHTCTMVKAIGIIRLFVRLSAQKSTDLEI
jgi:hypothetical protein